MILNSSSKDLSGNCSLFICPQSVMLLRLPGSPRHLLRRELIFPSKASTVKTGRSGHRILGRMQHWYSHASNFWQSRPVHCRWIRWMYPQGVVKHLAKALYHLFCDGSDGRIKGDTQQSGECDVTLLLSWWNQSCGNGHYVEFTPWVIIVHRCPCLRSLYLFVLAIV